MDPNNSAAAAKMVPMFVMGIGIASCTVMAILWGLGVMLAKGEGPTLADCFKKGIERFKLAAAKVPLLFIAALIFMVGHQLLSLQSSQASHDSKDLQHLVAQLAMSLVGMMVSIISGLLMALCQMVTFKNNRDIDQPATAVSGKSDSSLYFKLVGAAILSAIIVGISLLFFFIPGYIAQILLFIVGPVAIIEAKSGGAIARSFELCKAHFWSVTKIAMPLTLIAGLPTIIFMSLSLSMEPSIVSMCLGTLASTLTFVLQAIMWNCQSELYTYLTGNTSKQ